MTDSVRLHGGDADRFVAQRMSSFHQLLADLPPLLLLDASSTRVQVGCLAAGAETRWASSEDEAGIAVFECIKRLGVSLTQMRAFVYCDGPGSILGVRSVAMAIRTWCTLSPRPVFSYHSLELAAHAAGRPNLTFIADARRDTWHSIRQTTSLRRVATSELSGELAMPEGFRNWTKLPPAVQSVPYLLSDLVPRVMDLDLLRPTESPDAFLHEEPSYVTWTPKIHRAP